MYVLIYLFILYIDDHAKEKIKQTVSQTSWGRRKQTKQHKQQKYS